MPGENESIRDNEFIQRCVFRVEGRRIDPDRNLNRTDCLVGSAI